MTNLKVSTIEVKEIMDTSNPKYKSLRLYSETKKEGGSNPLGQFLKGGNPDYNLDKRSCIQPMHVDFIADLGVKEGSDLNSLLETPVRLAISEITESEFLKMKDEDSTSVISYSAKRAGAGGNFLVDANGEYIYRGIFVQNLDVADKTITHAGGVPDAPEFENGRTPQEETAEEEVQA